MNSSSTLNAQDHTSVALVSRAPAPCAPAACSGEQYAGVMPPLLTHTLPPGTTTSPAAARARAIPKSVTFTTPSRVRAERSVGESVEISRAEALRTLENAGSMTSSRWSVWPGSPVVGSRTAQIRPSPEDRPVRIRRAVVGSSAAIRAAHGITSADLRALLESPTRSINSLRICSASGTRSASTATA